MPSDSVNDSPSPLRGKVALITGASRGIGLAIAQALASEGCNLAITSRHENTLQKSSRELQKLGVTVLPLACDVREPADVAAVMQRIKKDFRTLDVLVNNAGIAHPNRNIDRLDFKAWRAVLATNLDGMFLITQAALPLMKRGSVIVNNLSIAAKQAFAGSSAYNASKHGALGFTNTLREELRPRGIRVIALLPGATDTAIWKSLWPEAPRRKMMSSQTIAQAVVNALRLPEECTLEELVLLPAAGTL